MEKSGFFFFNMRIMVMWKNILFFGARMKEMAE